MVRLSDWAHIEPPEMAFADERDCGVAGTERDMGRIDMVVYAPLQIAVRRMWMGICVRVCVDG